MLEIRNFAPAKFIPQNLAVHPQKATFPLNVLGRDFAVGDIHGCFSALQAALDTVNFSPSVDRLFSVGDLVDRGSESHLVLEWLDQPWFFAICGNHDFMTWRTALGNPYSKVDHQMHGGSWLSSLNAGAQQAIGKRLAALPLIIEIDTPSGLVGVVHADFPYDDWASLSTEIHSEADTESFLWSVERYQRQYNSPIRNLRALVHGHITIPEMKVLGNVYYIDTGGWSTGHFTLLDLHSLQSFRGPGETFIPFQSRRYR